MSKTWDMDWLARMIGYKEVALLEAAEQIERLEAEVERLSEALIAITPPPEIPLEVSSGAEAQDIVTMLNAGESAQNLDTRLDALEASKSATLLTELPITLTPDALNDKTIQ